MADKNDRWPTNAPGAWYVDRQCIDCDLCRTTAPNNFKRSEERHSYVSLQPRNPAEVEQCRQAAAECPVEAIGGDGGPPAGPPQGSERAAAPGAGGPGGPRGAQPPVN